jgi:hypothetical protein
MRRIQLFLLTLALSGCAAHSARLPPSQSQNSIAWDGLGEDPNKPHRRPAVRRHHIAAPVPDTATVEREKVLATLRPYSTAWWAVHDEIEDAQERKLSRKIVICRGCGMHPDEDEHTGSIPAQ